MVGKIFNAINNTKYTSFDNTGDLVELLKNQAIDDAFKLISNKKDIEISQNCYLLNYNVNHFGHFLGEVLGNILYLSDKNNHFLKDKNYSFAIFTPNDKWFQLIKRMNPRVNFSNLNTFKN